MVLKGLGKIGGVVKTELLSGKVYKTKDKKITLETGECPAQMLILK